MRICKIVKQSQLFNREVQILNIIRHENIVQFIGYELYNDNLYIFMEHCGPTLFDLYENHKIINRDEYNSCSKQILRGIAYIHGLQIVHRDIKLENICLLGSTIKIIDFGLSRCYADEELEYSLCNFCGTKSYCCPEIVSRLPYSGYAADSWSVGICLYALFYHSFPFELASCENDAYVQISKEQKNGKNIVDVARALYKKDDANIPFVIKNIIGNLLQINPNYRCRINESLSLKWPDSI